MEVDRGICSCLASVHEMVHKSVKLSPPTSLNAGTHADDDKDENEGVGAGRALARWRFPLQEHPWVLGTAWGAGDAACWWVKSADGCCVCWCCH